MRFVRKNVRNAVDVEKEKNEAKNRPLENAGGDILGGGDAIEDDRLIWLRRQGCSQLTRI